METVGEGRHRSAPILFHAIAHIFTRQLVKA